MLCWAAAIGSPVVQLINGLAEMMQSENGRPALVWVMPPRVRAVATSSLGGGLGRCEWVINAEVDDQYHRDPVQHLAGLAAEFGLAGRGCGLVTAARVRRYATGRAGGAECVTTVGLTHPVRAADADDDVTASPGTINTVCWVPTGLSDAALVNTVVTATEAKTQALLDAGLNATGTPSDAVVICCPENGTEWYGGPRSTWGHRVARATYEATLHGARQWLSRVNAVD